MSTEDLLELFDIGRELAGEARETWLAEIAGRDPAKAARLARLLRADSRGSSIFERQPGDLVGTSVLSTPATIGPYRIEREIGRGGMGRVYLAEQKGDGFVRRVAIKRLDRHDPWSAWERRFRDEVKILAALEHSGIARFLDGGRDADGAGYLVLEYVEGLDLLSHARARHLALAERLELFLEVLDAVEYAHGRRVLHRDLKPGNVLVGADGHAKLLDFGISKLLTADGAGEQTATRTENRALTPAYASPEQILGRHLTVASDVYSLGVMLYELVADARPFESDSGDAGAFERAVLEQEPEPPSTAARRRSSTDTTGELISPPAPAAGRLSRDLDAICLKTLRKEPAARYATVAELADDLRRYLEGRPVAARRGGFSYRASRLLTRHRALLVAALVTALVAAVLALAGQRLVAQRRLAALASKRPAPELSRIGQLSARFAETPDRPEIGLELAALQIAAGRGADAMSTVHRLRQLPDPLGKSLRIDLAEAEAALAVSEFQRAAASATAALAAAEAASDRASAFRARLLHGRALLRLTHPEEAERRLEALFDDAERAGDDEIAAEALVVRAAGAVRGQRPEEARELVDLALPRVQALGAKRLEAEALCLRARLEGESGRLESGLADVEAALGIARAGNDLAAQANALVMRSVLQNWRGDDAASLETIGAAVQVLRVTGNREQLLTTLGNLAISRIERAEFELAEQALGEAEPIARDLASPLQRGYIYRARGYLEEQRGNPEAGRASYEAAIAAARDAGAIRPLARYLAEIAWLEEDMRRPVEAEAAAREALEIFERVADKRSAMEVGAVLAWAEAAQGRASAARRRLAGIARATREADSESATFHYLLGEALVAEALGQYDEAVERRRASLAKAQTFALPTVILVQRYKLALALDWAGRRTEAIELAHKIVAEAERIGMRGLAAEARQLIESPVPDLIRG